MRPVSVKITRDQLGDKHKMIAIFYDENGKKIRTIRFGSALHSDMTKHKDQTRMELYLKRHMKRENWNNPLTAGSLSRYVLWSAPTLSQGINNFKNKFNLK